MISLFLIEVPILRMIPLLYFNREIIKVIESNKAIALHNMLVKNGIIGTH